MTESPLLDSCPYHPDSLLIGSNIYLTEGELRSCPQCELHLSACSSAQFSNALDEKWGLARSLDPEPKSMRRLRARRYHDWNIARRFLKQIDQVKYLDVGCATGTHVHIFTELGLDACGVDPSEQPILLGQQAGRKLFQGTLDEVHFPSESFDLISSYEVIEHIPNPVEFLTEISRVLKPGGVLILGTGNFDSWTRRLRHGRWDFFSLLEHGGHICFYSPKTFKKIAPMMGLQLVKANTYSVRFFEKEEVSWLTYRVSKIISEIASLFAKSIGKGHQMECFFVKQEQ
jgi:2-polyprenyl-3-methyl-5-hydroxy-6-metoxy-1,4-benzoquinol methylase